MSGFRKLKTNKSKKKKKDLELSDALIDAKLNKIMEGMRGGSNKMSPAKPGVKKAVITGKNANGGKTKIKAVGNNKKKLNNVVDSLMSMMGISKNDKNTKKILLRKAKAAMKKI